MRIIVPIKALSYNAYYRRSRNGVHVKTGAALEYDEELHHCLKKYADDFRRLNARIDPKIHVIKLDFKFYNPNYYIQDGSRLNMNSGDNDNRIKVLQDKIFLALGFDDYLAKKYTIEEVPSDVNCTEVTLSTCDHAPFESAISLCRSSEPTMFAPFPPL